MRFYHYLRTSDQLSARVVRAIYRGLRDFTLPAPKVITRPVLLIVVTLRSVYHFLLRIFWAEPLFKAYCKSYGRGVRTGIFLHWVMGKGDIILGDRVWIDGKCSFAFTQHYTLHPTLEIGNDSEVGHGCSFVIGKRITIGKNSRIAGNSHVRDTSGHPMEADLRRKNLPAHPNTVKPVTIGDDVWIGQNCIILPGTRIGDGAIISAGSVVRGKIPPYSVVAGNPAKVIANVPRPVDPGLNGFAESSPSESLVTTPNLSSDPDVA